MTCQEVMELIQRHQDQDLNEEEEIIMQEHLQVCPSCAIAFERMNLLSNELINLPKVFPAYSLVDRIMPQLDKIHEQSTEMVSSNKGVSWIKRMKASPPFKTLGGVVAAGIIFAVIMVNGMPNSLQDASNLLDTSTQKSSEMDMMTLEQAPESGAGASTFVDEENGSASSFKVNDQSGEQRLLEEGAPDSPQNGIMETAPVSEGDASPNEVQMVPAADDQQGGGSDASTSNNKSSGIMAEPVSQEYPSPNGEYIVSILQNETYYEIVITTVHEGTEIASSQEEADQITNIQWSEDSLYVQYDVIYGDRISQNKLEVK